jgi:dolichyl-diphosphooligosaccharide--protein glycosyltransferase
MGDSLTDSVSSAPGFASNIRKASAHIFQLRFLLPLFVFFLGLIVRWHLARYELFFEFDSYWHARFVSYILQGLTIPLSDPLAYYNTPHASLLSDPPLLFWYISAAVYKIVTLNAAYQLELWVGVVKFLPALYGALTCVAMYFLGKELFKGTPHARTAGFIAGLFAAIVPSFVYRTMGGFFEDDSLGFLWMVIGFVYFVRATRNPSLSKENLTLAVMAGLSFLLMALTWSAFGILVPILFGVGIIQYVAWLSFPNEITKAKHYFILWLTSFIIFAIGATYQTQFFWLSQLASMIGFALLRDSEILIGAPIMIILVGLVVVLYLLYLALQRNILTHGHFSKVFSALIIIAFLFPVVVGVFNLNLQGNDLLGRTIGEESIGNTYFGNKYSMLVVFAFIGVPAMAYLLFRRRHDYLPFVLPLVWVVFTFYLAWVKLKFTFYWGLPLALTASIVCVLALKWMARHSMSTQKWVAVLIGFMLVCGIAAGTFFVTQNVPNIEGTSGWKTALFWAEKNLPTDAKFFNWWDEGHWISFLANRKVLIDNRNADAQASATVAGFILADDTNKAIDLVNKYGSTHIIFGEDLLEKLPSLGFYAYDISDGSDPRIAGMFGRVLRCERRVTALTKEVGYSCSGNQFSEQEMNSLPTTWQSTSNNVQEGTSLFVYREKDNSRVYAFSAPANKTMLVRLWMHESSTTAQFNELYQSVDGVRIYQFNP